MHFACELKDFDPTDLDRPQVGPADGPVRADDPRGGAAGRSTDSGIDVAADPERVGASIATGIGGLRSFQDCYDVLRERGPDRVSPFSIP